MLYGFMYGNAKRRKFRSVWFRNEWQRNVEAIGYRDCGFRVRCFHTKPLPKHSYQGA